MLLMNAQAIVDHAGDIDVSLYNNYGGRGMGNRTTTGVVVGSDTDFLVAVAKTSAVLAHSNRQQLEAFFVDLAGVRNDLLGKGYIFY